VTELFALACPYCGEPIELVVDDSAGDAAYVEDCPVCCRPMQVDVEVVDAAVSVRVRTGDE
jgi:hypothetical protein